MPRLLAIGVASLLAISVVAAAPSAPGTAATTGYQPLPAPQRLVDTRVGERTADGEFAGIGIRDAGSTLQLTVAGRGGVPSGADAVVLNLGGSSTCVPNGTPMIVTSTQTFVLAI